MRPDGPRDPYAGPDAGPAPPFPLRISGPVVRGFGRGSKELGIPTANIPISGLKVAGQEDLSSGIYFGFAGLEERRSNDPASGDAAAAATATATTTTTTTTTTSSSITSSNGSGGTVHPMVMSLGYNPFYGNGARSVEVHVMDEFAADFYGAQLKLSILGFVRPEYDYVDRDALVRDIRTDIDVARRSLARPAWSPYADDKWLLQFDGKTEGT